VKKMWRSKKVIAIVVAAVLVIGGSVGVVLAADNGDEDGSPPEARHGVLLGRVCEIYEESTGTSIDPEALKDAFAQAQGEMRTEALNNWLQKLVDEDKIIQSQADQWMEWWQSRPDVPIRFGRPGRFSGRPPGGHCAPQNN